MKADNLGGWRELSGIRAREPPAASGCGTNLSLSLTFARLLSYEETS